MSKKDLKNFIQCDCGAEYLVLEPQDPEMLECGVFIGMFRYGYNTSSFWNRFRHIWHILTTGQPYVDQICLDLKKVKEIRRYFDNFIALAELDKKYTNKKGAK